MKKWILCIVLSLTVCVSACASGFHRQQTVAEKLVRLRVVANSDSEADQACKLRVRDAVLDCVGTLQSPEQVDAALLSRVEQAANECLRENGMPYKAKAELLWERYPTRSYDSFSLPAGLWRSLRITLGEGAGHNWWCVVFPALCTAGMPEEWKEAARNGGLSEGQIRWMQRGGCEYRFWILEWLQNIRQKQT